MTMKRVSWRVVPVAALAAAVLTCGQAPQVRAQAAKRSSSDVETRQTPSNLPDQEEERCKASDLLGMEVRGAKGDGKIGSISDMVLGQDGNIEYLAVSFGGFLGMRDKLFAVPFEAIDFVKNGADPYARIDVTEEVLKQKQGFNQDKWPSEADRSFTSGNLRRQPGTPSASR